MSPPYLNRAGHTEFQNLVDISECTMLNFSWRSLYFMHSSLYMLFMLTHIWLTLYSLDNFNTFFLRLVWRSLWFFQKTLWILKRRYSRLNRKLLHGRPRSSKNVKCSLPDCQMDDSDGWLCHHCWPCTFESRRCTWVWGFLPHFSNCYFLHKPATSIWLLYPCLRCWQNVGQTTGGYAIGFI